MKRLFSTHLLSTRLSSYYIRDVLASFTPINFAPPGVKWYIILRESVNTIKFDVLRQDESRSISENTTWGIRRKFEQGKIQINTTRFLGYDKDEEGNLIINEKQARTVRRIYQYYLDGRGFNYIARHLEADRVQTGEGGTKWYVSTVKKILTNEKYKGDVMAQKTYTVDFLNKVRVKNDGKVTQYLVLCQEKVQTK